MQKIQGFGPPIELEPDKPQAVVFLLNNYFLFFFNIKIVLKHQKKINLNFLLKKI